MTLPTTANEKSVKADRAVKFNVILGVNHYEDGAVQRVAALEVGPFPTVVAARDYARSMRGKGTALELTDNERADAYDLSREYLIEKDPPVAGATIEYYNDEVGTFDEVDVY